jgi:UDP-N-acetyl-D-galactosamine dehydrogenase
MIRVAREINEGMARHAAERLVKAMIAGDMAVKGARVLVCGFAFKENCPDIRNTKVVDMIGCLHEFGLSTEVVDPCDDPDDVRREYGLDVAAGLPARGGFDAVVLAVPHREIVAQGAAPLRALLRTGGILFDLPGFFPRSESDMRL